MPISAETVLALATDDELVAEITKRATLIPLIWGAEDVINLIGQEDAATLNETELDEVVRRFIHEVEDGTSEILSQRGNEHMGKKWAALGPDILAEIRAGAGQRDRNHTIDLPPQGTSQHGH